MSAQDKLRSRLELSNGGQQASKAPKVKIQSNFGVNHGDQSLRSKSTAGQRIGLSPIANKKQNKNNISNLKSSTLDLGIRPTNQKLQSLSTTNTTIQKVGESSGNESPVEGGNGPEGDNSPKNDDDNESINTLPIPPPNNGGGGKLVSNETSPDNVMFGLETFLESLSLTSKHMSNLQAGGFVLLSRRPTATAIYQLKVANGPSDVDPNDHCTLSLNGVTVVTHGDAVFTSLERFEHEYAVFKTILRSIPFFRRFRIWKQFTVWRKTVRRGKMSKMSASLEQSVRFITTIVPALTAIHGHCDDIENARLLGGIPSSNTGNSKNKGNKQGGSVGVGSGTNNLLTSNMLMSSGGSVNSMTNSQNKALEQPFKLEKFLAEQEIVREERRYQLEDFYSTVLALVTEACDSTVNAFLEEMQVDADQPMTFMDRAALRSKLRRLTHFMRFVDLMAVTSLRSLAIESVKDLAAAFSVSGVAQDSISNALTSLEDQVANVVLPVKESTDKSKKDAKEDDVDSKKEEIVVKPERVPLSYNKLEGNEDQNIILATSVRFFDNLEILGDKDENDNPPPKLLKQDKNKSNSQVRTPVFLIRADIREQKVVSASSIVAGFLNATKGDGDDTQKKDEGGNDGEVAHVLERDQVVASVEVSPSQEDAVSAVEEAIELALRLISVPGRIFGESSLDAYRAVAEGTLLPDMVTPLHHVISNDVEYRLHVTNAINDLTTAYLGVDVYLSVFTPYIETFIANKSIVENVTSTFEGDSADLHEYAQTILKFQNQVAEFDRIPSAGDVASLLVDSRHLKLGLMPSPVQCLIALKNQLPRLMEESSRALLQAVTEVLPIVTGTPTSVEQFVRKKTVTFDALATLPDLRKRQERISDMAALIKKNNWTMPDQQANDMFEVEQNLSMLENGIQVAQGKEEEDSKRFVKEVSEEVPRLVRKLQNIREALEKPALASLDSPIPETVEKVEKLSIEFESAKERCSTLTRYQEALGLVPDEYESLDDVGALLNLQVNLWRASRDFGELTGRWKQAPLANVDSGELEKVVQQYTKIAYRCSKGLTSNPCVKRLKKQVDDFSPVLPVVNDLRNDTLKARHWDQLHEVIGFEIHGDDSLTLGDLIEKNVTQFEEEITNIATVAQQESVLESMMLKVTKLWEPCELEVKPYKDVKDLYILGDTSEVVANLDDSLVTVNTVLSSRYVAGIREMVEGWRHTLNVMQETLDEWMNVQRNWMYLEAIFGSPDIVRQLPVAAKLFKTVDISWKSVMKATFEEPNALKAATFHGRKAMFEAHNVALDKIQKSLEEYLETKRAAFPRFYFLSDDELLQILAQAKDPHAVQPHLRKCFDNLVQLTFGSEEGSVDILSMKSSEGEVVSLGKNLKARGNVEDWMTLLEQRMKIELTQCMKEGLIDYDMKERQLWVDDHPGQVVATVAQMTWARGTEKVLKSDDPIHNMPEWLQWQIDELNNLVLRIRSNLTSLQRKVIVALTTTDVHARDILDEMVTKRCESIDDFLWQQQLRYYWEKNGADDDCVIRHADSLVQYGYEYMGATSRLVITPMTDRCWLTLTASYGLKLGGAPAGPAGTGKTESSKDLAKAMAICCVVFNCSDQIDYKMMGKLFRGLAQGGYWICLDEFNRIDIEVLSVVAQQMVVLKEGRIAGKKQINFMGINIKLVDHHVIVTMNPGYAGRTELPDNLQVCFRPVSMMVPNYALIAEIMLFAEGFGDAKTLSRKMCKLYILCSEQLSQQPHYDYGLRAVKSVLVMAGGLKRAHPELPEDLVLIRALRDSNQPKFLADDIPLFQAIILDLFPGVEIPPNDYGEFLVTMEEELEKANLIKVPGIMNKIIQMFDVFCIRFGATLVGPASGGKSTIFRILAAIMTSLRLKNSTNPIYQPVVFEILNPKCIRMGELYGEFHPLTQEWTDGLASTMMRKFVDYDDPRGPDVRRWTVFDGPIDAIWIENMNTVLDDNMTLCLANGERIKLKNEMKCLFEVMDLAVASPATVSRIGVVYVTSSLLGWYPYIQTWSKITLSSTIPQEVKNHILSLFEEYFPKGLEFQRKKCKEPVETVDIQLAMSLAALIQSLFRPSTDLDLNRTGGGGGDQGISLLKPCKEGTDEPADYEKEEIDVLNKLADKVFVFSFIWSIGASCREQDWEKFDLFARDAVSSPLNTALPPMGLVFDYFVDLGTDSDGGGGGQFKEWTSILPSFTYDSALPYSQIMVPTVDTRRFSFVITSLITVMKPIFLTGVTGTGKTVMIQNLLSALEPMPFEDPNGMGVIPIFVNFSAQTSSLITQQSIESKLEKKRKNLLGAPAGRKCVVFVDDVNMPLVETYGAQPPCELLRQFLDHKGFYDREKLFWKDIVDTLMFVGAAPPGGGRNAVTPRMTRHCNVLCVPSASDSAMTLIFTSILTGFVHKFDSSVKSLVKGTCEATVELYNRISAELLPTPAKFHYTFNLRDVSKVFQGMLMVTTKSCNTSEIFTKLWIHETMRVFYDRMINFDDQLWFTKSVVELSTRYLHTSWTHEELFEDEKTPPIMFVDYLKPGADVRLYEPVLLYNKLEPLLDDYLDEYNINFPTTMSLVFFRDAILHISRMTRILRQPRGNAMLVGVGGSGKQSSTRIAAFASNMECVQIAISRGYGIPEFREDIKNLMIKTGVEGRQTVFLFTDSQIVVETMLEDLNNVLNSGEIPNLFLSEEVDKIVASMIPVLKEAGIPETKDNCLSQFVLRVRDKLHIVLGMSPVGSALRVRCRNFPSLISCTTIDWFMPWPESALVAVANKFLHNLSLPNEEIRQSLVESCGFVHTSISDAANKFYDELRRMVYTTPKSYLDLIGLYTNKLGLLQADVDLKRDRMMVGVEKLTDTEAIVDSLKADLKRLEPVLVQKSLDADELLRVVAIEKADADIVKEKVSADEAVVAAQASEVSAVAADAQKDLDLAMPALSNAVRALNSLTKGDITEVKSFAKPPPAVQTVMEGVCIMLGQKPDWDTAKKVVLADSNFLDKLKNYDKDNISPDILKKLQKNLQEENMRVEVVSKVSKAATGLCMWVHAMDVYSRVAKEVEPKKARLAEMNKILADANAVLAQKQAELKAVVDKVEALQTQADETLEEKNRLAAEQQLTANRLERAEQLTNGLGSEGVRWKATVETLEVLRVDLIGDTFLSCAAISYYGPFTGTYRDELVTNWLDRCRSTGIPCSEHYSLVSTLGDPVEVRDWENFSLPSDPVSTNNGILVTRARRWPLMIDPQGQANRWIRRMEQEKDLSITTMKDINLLRSLENCVRIGKPLLIEDIEESLEPALEPILQRAVYKKGNRNLIIIGDGEVDYDPNFKLYMTSKMPNPHYMPEVCIKVTVINFTVTMAGLEDQLLAMTVVRERPDIEERKVSLLLQMAADGKQLAELEATILRMLSESKGNILDDSDLINTLNESKKTSTLIKGRVEEAEKTEIEINSAREEYRKVATRGSLIYFSIADLPNIDPMYQYSLDYYQQLFDRCLMNSDKAKDLQQRLTNVIDFTTFFMYNNICRGLFERDKVLFSALLCFSILRDRNEISPVSWPLFVRGAGPVDRTGQSQNPNTVRISEFQWDLLYTCETQVKINSDSGGAAIFPFAGLPGSIARNYPKWLVEWIDVEDPVTARLPFGFEDLITPFERLLLIKALREDKLLEAVRHFVSIQLGEKFAHSPSASMDEIYADLTNATPCIFILSKGADPTGILLRFAKSMNYQDRLPIVSLGQGQGPYAEALIKKGCSNGDWVFLQNCMLAKSWMSRLEHLVFELAENQATNHKDFRLFLSSSPVSYFPVSVLQNGVKMTNEPPAGVRANVSRSFGNLVKDDVWEGCSKPQQWKKLVTALCFFHANIQERRKFGPLGWNVTYAFDESDLEFSMSILRRMIEAQDIVPWDALNYITGQINYGGRVTDDNDKTCLMAVLRKFFTPPVLSDEYVFSNSGKYYAPKEGSLDELTNYLDTLPSVDDPEIFGMHENANTTFNTSVSVEMMGKILSLQPRTGGGGGGKTSDEIVTELADLFISQVPAILDEEEAGPTTFVIQENGLLNSIAIVLTQEIIKFNRLINKMQTSLSDIKKAIQGFIVMSPELDEMFIGFMNNTLPGIWTKVSFASLKSLGSWVKDLISRVTFFRKWLVEGMPYSFALPVFFFPQGFMTGTLQTFARKYSVAIDTLSFKFDAKTMSKQEPLQLEEGPSDGVYCYGLFVEGARWDNIKMQLAVSKPKEMFCQLPMVHFLPAVDHKCSPQDYACPVYKTAERKGVLSTTGMSTNFVIAVELPTDQDPDIWVMYGVACLCVLTD